MKKLIQFASMVMLFGSCTVNHYHYTLPNEVIITTSKPVENPYNYVPSILNETGKPFSYTPPSSTSQDVSISNTSTNTNSTSGSSATQSSSSTYTPSSSSSTYTPTSSTTSSRTIYTGPRGGKYYINSHGNKTYVRKK